MNFKKKLKCSWCCLQKIIKIQNKLRFLIWQMEKEIMKNYQNLKVRQLKQIWVSKLKLRLNKNQNQKKVSKKEINWKKLKKKI